MRPSCASMPAPEVVGRAEETGGSLGAPDSGRSSDSHYPLPEGHGGENHGLSTAGAMDLSECGIVGITDEEIGDGVRGGEDDGSDGDDNDYNNDHDDEDEARVARHAAVTAAVEERSQMPRFVEGLESGAGTDGANFECEYDFFSFKTFKADSESKHRLHRII